MQLSLALASNSSYDHWRKASALAIAANGDVFELTADGRERIAVVTDRGLAVCDGSLGASRLVIELEEGEESLLLFDADWREGDLQGLQFAVDQGDMRLGTLGAGVVPGRTLFSKHSRGGDWEQMRPLGSGHRSHELELRPRLLEPNGSRAPRHRPSLLAAAS